MNKTSAQRKPSSDLKSVLAANVRGYREKEGLSQEAFADLCGFHRTYVGSLERCERNATLSTLETLARAMRVLPADLLTPDGVDR